MERKFSFWIGFVVGKSKYLEEMDKEKYMRLLCWE